MGRKPKADPQPTNLLQSGGYSAAAAAASGLKLSAEQIPILDGSEQDRIPEFDDAGEIVERNACQYCGRPFKNLPRHELGCKMRPAAPVEPPAGISVESLGIALAGAFDLASARYGEHWHLSELEASTLAAQWKPVLDAYFPSLAGSRFMLVLFALSYTGVLVQSRVAESREISHAKTAKQATPGSSHVMRERGDGQDGLSAPATKSVGAGASL